MNRRIADAPKQVYSRQLTPLEARQKFRQVLTNAIVERMERMTADEVLSRIIREVDEQRERLVQELLGVSAKWGKVEVDHCNGRVSAIDAAMKQQCQAKLQEIIKLECNAQLEKALTNKDHPIRKAIRTEFANQTNGYALRSEIEGHAKAYVNQLVTQEVDAIRKEVLSADEEQPV